MPEDSSPPAFTAPEDLSLPAPRPSSAVACCRRAREREARGRRLPSPRRNCRRNCRLLSPCKGGKHGRRLPHRARDGSAAVATSDCRRPAVDSPRMLEHPPSSGFSTEPSHTPEPPLSPHFSPEPPPSPRMSESPSLPHTLEPPPSPCTPKLSPVAASTQLCSVKERGPYPFTQGYNSKLIFHKSFFYFYLYFFNPKPWDPSNMCQK